MDKNERYFISLVFSHLNNTVPEAPEGIDLSEIYRLALINNIAAVISVELQKLDDTSEIDPDIMSAFRQQTGYTIIDTEKKNDAVAVLKNAFGESNIDFLFVKGQIIRNYYPVPALRTSADTDVIVLDNDLSRVKKLFDSYELFQENAVGFSFKINNQTFEIHSTRDYDNEYFKDIFSLCTKNGSEYVLDDYNHLIYILCHIAKHMKYCGAGIKMFMDIDVIIRHIENFDYDRALAISKKAGVEMFFKYSLSLCHSLFGTPVRAEVNLDENAELKELFEKEIVSGGNFGFSNRGLGDFYEIEGGRNGGSSKLKAYLALIFPKKEYLKRYSSYAEAPDSFADCVA